MSALKRPLEEVVGEVEGALQEELMPLVVPIRFDHVVSTGSTLLDCSISGTRVRGGGIPGGIMAEVSGPPGSGKTALMMETMASVQLRGGDFRVRDPEARVDKEYAEVYGCKLDLKESQYDRPNTVVGVFDGIYKWEPKPMVEGAVCAQGIDSLAALCANEDEVNKGDKRGQARAKQFSQELRRVAVLVSDMNWLIFMTNQEREDDSGRKKTTGGQAIPFYCSLRIRMFPTFDTEDRKPLWQIKRTRKIGGSDREMVIGVRSTARVFKNSCDIPFREAEVFLVFADATEGGALGVGIDDVRANLHYRKDWRGDSDFDVFGKKGIAGIDRAIAHIENNGLQKELREATIDLWLEVQEKFRVQRKLKERW